MRTASILTALVVSLATGGAALAQWPGERGYDPDDLRCQEWGAEPGTAAYFECRSTLERQRGDQRNRPSPAAPREETITDSMARSMCEAHARRVAPYPIKRLASNFVFPGREPRVSLSFSVEKPGSSTAFWNVDCKFRGRRMIDFSGR